MSWRAFRRGLLVAMAAATSSADAQERLEKPSGFLTPTRMDTGPAPGGITVTGNPASATVSWQPVSGAVSYKVVRTKADDPNCCRGESPALTSTTWSDTGPNGQGLQWSGSYVFTVSAIQGNSMYGTSSVTWTKPEPVNPTGLMATQVGEGSVSLKWNHVDGAYYWLFGPGANGSEGIRVDLPGKLLTGVPAGQHEWKVTSKYDPAGFLLAADTWPRVTLNVEKLSGYYRIVLNGVVANSPTTDHALNLDGWGDELLFLSETLIFDRGSSSPTRKGKVQAFSGVTFGDVNKFPNRIRAGSLTPSGGIGKGDAVPSDVDLMQPYASPRSSELPLLMWEGQLKNGREVVVVNALILEMDDDNARSGVALPYAECPVDHVYELPSVQAQLSTSDILPPATEPIRESPKCERSTEMTYGDVRSAPFNRPIGDLPGRNDPSRYLQTANFLVLTREKIEQALGGNSHAIVTFDRVDKIEGQNGHYTMYVLIQRI